MVVRPINILSKASKEYFDGEATITHDKFSKLSIHTGDEIGMLAESMTRMEQELNDHITSLLATVKELKNTREYADELNEISKIDALTQVKNKRAYDMECQRLNDEIDAGTAAFGIIMADLNNLKTINDTYGHDKGDKAIKRLCRMLCDTFKHSPVFRIGGDEFVIIVEKQDYENVNKLIGTFDDNISRTMNDTGLELWERTTAAIGYSAYESGTDRKVASVQRRADEIMYKRKKAMKKSVR